MSDGDIAAFLEDWNDAVEEVARWRASGLPDLETLPTRDPLRRRLRRGAGAWLGAHALSIGLVAALLVFCGVLLGVNITHFPGFQDDEGTYTAEAWSLIHTGQLSHYSYWYDHPPLGWLALGILTTLFGGLVKATMAVATARALMLIPALITLTLTFVLARRLAMSRAAAALAVLLIAVSPLGLQGLREVYLENFAMPWVLGAFILATSPRERLWAFAGSGLCLAIAVLSKETTLLFLPGLLVAVFHNAGRRTRTFCLVAFSSTFALIVLGYPLYALLKGELLPTHSRDSLWYGATWQLFTRQGSGSLLVAHSVSRQTVDAWLVQDPWTLALGVAAMLPALAVRRLRPLAVGLAFAVLEAVRGGYLPVPFDIQLMPLCALLTAGIWDMVWRWRAAAEPAAPAGLRRWERVLSPRRAGSWVAVLLVMVFAVLAGPRWVRADHRALTDNAVAPELKAERWVTSHVPRDDRVLVDDTIYVDLVRAGFAPRYGVIWFYKLGTDSSVRTHLPNGWREISYVVSSPALRAGADTDHLPQVNAALAHSRVVASFGQGSDRFLIRRVVVPSSLAGDTPVRTGAHR